MKKTPFEEYIKNKEVEFEKTAKLQSELNKYGKKTPSGGMVWTVGDMQRFFARKKK